MFLSLDLQSVINLPEYSQFIVFIMFLLQNCARGLHGIALRISGHDAYLFGLCIEVDLSEVLLEVSLVVHLHFYPLLLEIVDSCIFSLFAIPLHFIGLVCDQHDFRHVGGRHVRLQFVGVYHHWLLEDVTGEIVF